MIEVAWPTLAPALPLFLTGPNDRLQTVCTALAFFLEFIGHWDECYSLERQAEAKAIASGDHFEAGWRTYWEGRINYLWGQGHKVIVCADRTAVHWQNVQTGPQERAMVIRLRGLGFNLKNDCQAAIAAFREALDLFRTVSPESVHVAETLTNIANIYLSFDLEAAERGYCEALRVARVVGHTEGIVYVTGNLAAVALRRTDWPRAEALAREALSLSKKVGRKELIAVNAQILARALVRQGKVVEAVSHARRAVDILSHFGSHRLESARATLQECES
jgi:tetratricopeptide (TPR) repeat protein